MTNEWKSVLAPIALALALLGTVFATFATGDPDSAVLGVPFGLAIIVFSGFLLGWSWSPLHRLSRRALLIVGVVLIVLAVLVVLDAFGPLSVPNLPVLSSPYGAGLSITFGTACLVARWTGRGPTEQGPGDGHTGVRDPPPEMSR